MNLTDRLKNYLQESQETPSDNAVIDGNTGVDYYVTSACIDDASGQQAIKAVRVRPSQQAQLGDEEFLILRDLLVHLIQSKQLHFATLHKSKKNSWRHGADLFFSPAGFISVNPEEAVSDNVGDVPEFFMELEFLQHAF